jgi:predicted GNAT superfamily acetyltransferase
VARAVIDVHRVEVDELGDVLGLWAQGRAEISRMGRAPASAEQVATRLTEAVAAGQIEILLARREGRPAGFVILRETPLTFMVDQPSISIDQLFVAVDERRRGVARAMLAQVASRAERSGAEQIVSSVTPWARETHRFFARLGFAPVIVRRSVTTASLRRRLSGESHRGALEDLLSRRRSLRARSRQQPGALGELGERSVS